MTCFHPLIRVCKKSRVLNGKTQTVKIVGPKDYGDNFLEYFDKQNEYYQKYYPEYEAQRIPCGKCIGCRLDYSKNGQRVAS